MDNNRITYIQRVIRMFTFGSFSAPTVDAVWRWLVDDDSRKEKDTALEELWDESLLDSSKEDVDDAWATFCSRNGIKNTSHSRSNESRRHVRILHIWQSVAAVFIIGFFLAAGFIINKGDERSADIVQSFTPIASTSSLILPDGTEVQLNSRSILLYPEKFEGDTRSVFLVGEACFKVKPDKEHPFIVKSDKFHVTALGTEFNVNAYPENEEITATLIEGKVMVESGDMTSKSILKPEQQLAYNRLTGECTLRHPDMDDVTAWQRGELVFSKMTVPDILRVLERKYNYEFVYVPGAFRKDRYTFRFRSEAPLQEVMEVVRDVAGNITFDIDGSTCRVRNR